MATGNFGLAMVGSLALSAGRWATADVITFDSMIEGMLSQTLTIGGVTFTNLDPRLPFDEDADARFAIDDMRGSLNGRAGFTPNNCLGFGGYWPGPGGGYYRMGSFDILPATLATRASIEIFDLGPNPPGTTLNLEAYRNGVPIGLMTVAVSPTTVVHRTTLTYQGSPCDRLLVFVGPTDQSVIFAVADGVDVVAIPRCEADADGNGAVDPADLALFISRWYGGILLGSLSADFDGDGAITPTDVATFVQAWLTEATGPCAP